MLRSSSVLPQCSKNGGPGVGAYLQKMRGSKGWRAQGRRGRAPTLDAQPPGQGRAMPECTAIGEGGARPLVREGASARSLPQPPQTLAGGDDSRGGMERAADGVNSGSGGAKKSGSLTTSKQIIAPRT